MNCKIGDLAIIIKTGRGFEECIGRIVEVLALLSDNRWHVEFVGPIPPMTDAEAKKRGTRGFWISDDYLRPITGLPIDDEVTEELKEPA